MTRACGQASSRSNLLGRHASRTRRVPRRGSPRLHGIPRHPRRRGTSSLKSGIAGIGGTPSRSRGSGGRSGRRGGWTHDAVDAEPAVATGMAGPGRTGCRPRGHQVRSTSRSVGLATEDVVGGPAGLSDGVRAPRGCRRHPVRDRLRTYQSQAQPARASTPHGRRACASLPGRASRKSSVRRATA